MPMEGTGRAHGKVIDFCWAGAVKGSSGSVRGLPGLLARRIQGTGMLIPVLSFSHGFKPKRTAFRGCLLNGPARLASGISGS